MTHARIMYITGFAGGMDKERSNLQGDNAKATLLTEIKIDVGICATLDYTGCKIRIWKAIRNIQLC